MQATMYRHAQFVLGLQALNVAVGETSEYNVTVVKPTVYQGDDWPCL